MNIKPRGDVTRLAKWAQEYVHSLLRKIEDLEKRLDDLAAEHADSNVMIAGFHEEPDIGLPENSRIYFYAAFPGEANDRLTNMVEVHHDRELPHLLHIASYGSRGVKIIPSASNSFYLEMDRR